MAKKRWEFISIPILKRGDDRMNTFYKQCKIENESWQEEFDQDEMSDEVESENGYDKN